MALTLEQAIVLLRQSVVCVGYAIDVEDGAGIYHAIIEPGDLGDDLSPPTTWNVVDVDGNVTPCDSFAEALCLAQEIGRP